MSTPTQCVSRPVACMPLFFGVSSILLSSIYMLQRSGLLGSIPLERFVQHHLDGIGITAFALAGIGMALGLYLGRGGRRTALLVWGTVISVVGAFAQLLLPRERPMEQKPLRIERRTGGLPNNG